MKSEKKRVILQREKKYKDKNIYFLLYNASFVWRHG